MIEYGYRENNTIAYNQKNGRCGQGIKAIPGPD